MAKKSQINRNLKRQKTVARFASRRQALKAIIRNPESSFDERQEAMAKLRQCHVTRVRLGLRTVARSLVVRRVITVSSTCRESHCENTRFRDFYLAL